MRFFYTTFALVVAVCFSANAQPVASFTISRTTVCSGSNVYLTNTSTGANAYQWYVDDTLYSTSTNDSIIMLEGCWELQTVDLVAINTSGGSSDTVRKIVEVFDSCAMHLSGDLGNCIGDTIRLASHSEAVSQGWVIDPPHMLLTGCDTCDSISFVLTTMGTTARVTCIYEGGCSQKTSFHYPMCDPLIGTSVHGPEKEGIKIYPNPANNKVIIEVPDKSSILGIALYNQAGSLMIRQENPGISEVDIAHLSAGVYYLKVQLKTGIVTEEIVKL